MRPLTSLFGLRSALLVFRSSLSSLSKEYLFKPDAYRDRGSRHECIARGGAGEEMLEREVEGERGGM